MHRTTITGKGQVTIPAAIRERFGLKNGDVLEFIPQGEHLQVKVMRRYLAHELVGILESDVSYPGSFEEERRLAAEAYAEEFVEKNKP